MPLKSLRAWFLRLHGIFHKEHLDRDLHAELASHLEMHIEENLRAGMTPEEARRNALLKLGGIEQTKESVRDRRGIPLLETLLQDMRFALRMLRKSPGFTAVVVLTLALGIGVNTAVFSVVNGVLLRPLPAPSPEQLAVLAIAEKGSPIGALGFSYPQFSEFRKQAAPFCDVFGAALAGPARSLTADDRTDQMALTAVANNYFSGLGVKPAIGRLILPNEGETPGEEAVLVLGHSYWQGRFGGDPGIVGKKVRIDGIPVTIIGVLPKEFHGSFTIFEIDGYVPLSTITRDEHWSRLWTDRNFRMILAMARLNKGVSIAQAQAGLDVISARLAKQYPATDNGVTVRVIPERLARPIPYANNAFIVISALFIALGALVLLLACTNVANILVARAFVRQREMAIRTALGASRGRLVRQMLVESLMLALLSGIGGVIFAVWANRLVGSIHVPGLPLQLDCSLDWRVFSFAFAAALFSGVFAGLLPTYRTTRADVNAALHEGARSGVSIGSRHRVHRDLMVVQVAGSLTLLIVAGLFVRSLRSAESMYMGFDPDHLLNVALDPHDNYYDEAQTNEFYRELKAKVIALPGIQSVSIASFVPIESSPSKQAVYIENRPIPPDQRPPSVLFNRVDTGYFKTLVIPILRGREFTESDDKTAPPVAIINQTMASQFWPHQDPIGKRFSSKNQNGPFLEVVGVMQDGKYNTIGEDPQSYFCVPLPQDYVSGRTMQIRSSVPPQSLGAEVRREIRILEPGISILDLRTMKESLAGAKGFFSFRFAALLAAAMGTLGLILAIVGVYGVVSYAATQRTHEIGIRRALGASANDIRTLILGQGIRLVIGGVLVGLLGAWVLSRAMAHLLLGVSPSDPVTYAGFAILLSCVALFACYIPARRAMRVDPMIALRYE
jgi:predicted permease